MRVSLEWLKEYVTEIPEDVSVLSERLAMIGFMLDKPAEKIGVDTVLDLEFRRNRADCEGMVGMAREVVAAFGGDLKLPETADLSTAREQRECAVKITSPELVNRFFTAYIKVQPKETPDWMRKRITAYGMEVDGNIIVDTTNYVLIELGQPLHAFDLGKLRSLGDIDSSDSSKHTELELVKAKNGETISLIGKKKVVLENEDLLISQFGKPLAIAGVMGGEESSVDSDTKEIILEAANYDRVSIRLTSRRLGLTTEAADRLQKDLDPNLAETAIRRVLYILQNEADAELIAVSDYYPSVARPKTVEFNPLEVKRYCGVDVPEYDMAKILEGLGFEVDREREEGQTWDITVPTSRTDVSLPVDIIEEVVRIWGYDKIPSINMQTPIPAPIHMKGYELEERLRDIFVSMGLDELITIGATTKTLITHSYKDSSGENSKAIKVEAPPTRCYQYLRTNMFATLLDSIKVKADASDPRIAVFEIGRVYFGAPDKKIDDPKIVLPYDESRRVVGVLSGHSNLSSWVAGNRRVEYTLFDAKGTVSEALDKLGVSYGWEASDHPSFEDGTVISAIVEGKTVAQAGQVALSVSQKCDIKQPLFAFEIYTDILACAEKGYKKMSKWSNYPKVTRDISVIVPKAITNEEVVELAKAVGGKILYSIEPIDVYEGEKIAKGTKNIVYSLTYWSKQRTLTAKEVESLHRKIGEKVVRKFKARISGWGESKTVEEKTSLQKDQEADIVVGKILKVEKHPFADKLAVVTVNLGDEYPEYRSGDKLVVCGAENIVAGGEKVVGVLVPVALPGATVKMAVNKERTEYKECEVKSAEIRGVRSDGMLCSKLELGKGKDDEGIWILNKTRNKVGKLMENSS